MNAFVSLVFVLVGPVTVALIDLSGLSREYVTWVFFGVMVLATVGAYKVANLLKSAQKIKETSLSLAVNVPCGFFVTFLLGLAAYFAEQPEYWRQPVFAIALVHLAWFVSSVTNIISLKQTSLGKKSMFFAFLHISITSAILVLIGGNTFLMIAALWCVTSAVGVALIAASGIFMESLAEKLQ